MLIDNILKGWEDFKVSIIAQKEVTRTWNVYQDSVEITDVLPYLCLIAHFIKKTDKVAKDPHLFLVRHERLRKDLWQQANALSCLLHDELLPHHHIKGIDAASSEFDASPEVFAPIYRYMRHEGVLNATFHAGEDFYHIISGIRAIYEAVHFLGLQSGNRIGHAVALGICPSLWRQTMGRHIYIRQGEWLDNLIFVRHYILTHCENDVRVIGLLPRIESEIHRHANQIYREYQPNTAYEVCIFSLTEAWLNRKWCPMLWNCANYVEAQQMQTFDMHEWGSICEEKERATKKIRKLMDDYHEPKYKKAYDKIIKIDTCKDDFFSVTDIESLQDFMLEELAKKEIVLETLPTSNVRIGIYSNFAQHHLKRWLGLQTQHQCKHYPKVVVGSDDTGIFATNIYNEYAHIYLNMACTDADTHIRNLQYNSNVYNFYNR